MRSVAFALAAAFILASSTVSGHVEPVAPAVKLEGMVGPALYISDPDRSLKFYTEGLGMKLRMRFGPKERPDMVVGFGMDPTEAGIMLITDKEGPIRPVEHVHGFDRIALRLPDLAAVSEQLRKAGFEAGDIRTVHGSIKMMMITDPDGYKIELIDSQPTPKKP